MRTKRRSKTQSALKPMLPANPYTQELKGQAALKVEVSGGWEKRELVCLAEDQVSPCPAQPGPTPFPVPAETVPLGKLIPGSFQSRDARHSWGGAEAPDRNEIKGHCAASSPLQSSLSQVGSQNAGCQAYIQQPETREKTKSTELWRLSQRKSRDPA